MADDGIAGARASAAARRQLLRSEARSVRGAHVLAVLAGLGATIATIVQAYAIATLLDLGAMQRVPLQQLSPWLSAFAAAVALKAGCAYIAERAGASGARTVQRRLRKRVVDALFAPARVAEASFAPRAAQHAYTLIEQVDRIGPYVARYVPRAWLAVVGPVVFLAVIFPTNWVIGSMLLCTTPVIPLYMWLIGKDAEGRSTRQLGAVRFLSTYFLDRLQGLATLKSLGGAERELERIEATSEDLGKRSMEVLNVALLSSAALEFFSMFAIALVAMYVGFSLLGDLRFGLGASGMSLQVGMFVLLLAPAYFQPLRAFAAAYHDRADALAAAEHLLPLMQPIATHSEFSEAAPREIRSIALHDVTHRFDGQAQPALERVTLTIGHGLIGVTGPSGAGKSTLLGILGGLVTPTHGAVVIDAGEPGLTSASELRGACSWLGQRPYLFPVSIADNILLARADATCDEGRAAARRAGVLEFAEQWPNGLLTTMGERGRQVSGGQAQRVALARAFLRNAPVVLLDEPTAFLDAATEAELIDAIVALARERVVVVATHSSRVIARCERVVQLEAGTVVREDALVASEPLRDLLHV